MGKLDPVLERKEKESLIDPSSGKRESLAEVGLCSRQDSRLSSLKNVRMETAAILLLVSDAS